VVALVVVTLTARASVVAAQAAIELQVGFLSVPQRHTRSLLEQVALALHHKVQMAAILFLVQLHRLAAVGAARSH
jgi:hypothetical protein